MCERNNYRCSKCGQLVNKRERQMHDEEECGKQPESPVPKLNETHEEAKVDFNQKQEISDCDMKSQEQ